MILYVSEKCRAAPRFGKTKLNKMLWRADFTSFHDRGVPVTGRAYQRLQFGPAPVEMAPVLGEMRNNGEVSIDRATFSDGVVEERTIPLQRPNLAAFSQDDLRYVDAAINYYWDETAVEVSDDSHGVAWKTRENGDPMPYELAYLSDRTLPLDIKRKIATIGTDRGWKSQ